MANFTVFTTANTIAPVSTVLVTSVQYATNDEKDLWSTIAAIAYFSLYFILIIVLSIYIHQTEEHEDKASFFYTIWTRRSIYGEVLVQLYDIAIDFGVLIEWYLLANDDIDYKSIDMHVMFWTAISFQILHRLVASYFAFVVVENGKQCNVSNLCLSIFDLYIIKLIYQSFKESRDQPSNRQRTVNLIEAAFEALPQVSRLYISFKKMYFFT